MRRCDLEITCLLCLEDLILLPCVDHMFVHSFRHRHRRQIHFFLCGVSRLLGSSPKAKSSRRHFKAALRSVPVMCHALGRRGRRLSECCDMMLACPLLLWGACSAATMHKTVHSRTPRLILSLLLSQPTESAPSLRSRYALSPKIIRTRAHHKTGKAAHTHPRTDARPHAPHHRELVPRRPLQIQVAGCGYTRVFFFLSDLLTCAYTTHHTQLDHAKNQRSADHCRRRRTAGGRIRPCHPLDPPPPSPGTGTSSRATAALDNRGSFSPFGLGMLCAGVPAKKHA